MTPSYLLIHDSDSRYGNPYMVEAWHKERGFSWFHENSHTFIHTGYHYILLNGRLYSGEEIIPEFDGAILPARPESVMGAHCTVNGRNHDSLGICLIGPPFGAKQFVSLIDLCLRLMRKYSIPAEKVVGHNEQDNKKLDPRFDMNVLRAYLQLAKEK